MVEHRGLDVMIISNIGGVRKLWRKDLWRTYCEIDAILFCGEFKATTVVICKLER